MAELSEITLLEQIDDLKARLSDANQLIQAIKDGEVDAFAVGSGDTPEIYTLQSGDYAYRLLIEESGEGALNTTEDGLIVYTNRSFFELIGLPYEKVIGSNIFDYLHPGSELRFKELFNTGLSGKTKGEINLAINGKIIPVYVSLTSLRPSLPTVGIIISDLTQIRKNESTIIQYQASLEEKNQVLMRANEELASFAYIASHDLQEPLRKIEIFSNRILEKSGTGLTPELADYFNRIVRSIRRMQSLIRALLEYSRLSITGATYVKTDLNTLVQDVKVMIAESIEENKAVIAISALPVLNVIPQQMNQLFSNILLNAIKYKKDGTNPLITISTLLVDAHEVPGPAPGKHQKYWRIRIADNGIGFDPAYSERIFEVFQRLHGLNKYEGTGIGLAICRKIMLTHGGYITGEGIPGAGAAFNIYLPLIL